METQFVSGRGCYPAIHAQTLSLKTSCTGAGTNWVSVSVVTFAFISHQNYRIMNHVCGMKVILLLWLKIFIFEIYTEIDTEIKQCTFKVKNSFLRCQTTMKKEL